MTRNCNSKLFTVSKGADVNAKNKDGLSALDMAVNNGHQQIVQALQAKMTQAGPKGGGGPAGGSGLDDALVEAATKGDLAAVQALLAKGANVNARDNHGKTPLMVAAFQGHVSVVKSLLAKGADINAKDSLDGSTALSWAECNHDAKALEVIEVLERAGAR
jgi:ankyrin repeat protein